MKTPGNGKCLDCLVNPFLICDVCATVYCWGHWDSTYDKPHKMTKESYSTETTSLASYICSETKEVVFCVDKNPYHMISVAEATKRFGRVRQRYG